jgi:hypothetical protein
VWEERCLKFERRREIKAQAGQRYGVLVCGRDYEDKTAGRKGPETVR